MNVVAHQAVGQDRKLQTIAADAQTIEIETPVEIVPKDVSSLVAASDDVIDGPLALEA
jgi:hypothetical protein